MNLFGSTRATPTELCELEIYDNPVVVRVREKCFSVEMLSETAKKDEINHLKAEQEISVLAEQEFDTLSSSSSKRPSNKSSSRESTSQGRPTGAFLHSAQRTPGGRPVAQVPKMVAISKYSTLAYKPANVKQAVLFSMFFTDSSKTEKMQEVRRLLRSVGEYMEEDLIKIMQTGGVFRRLPYYASLLTGTDLEKMETKQ